MAVLDCLREKIAKKQVVEVTNVGGLVLPRKTRPPDGCDPKECVGLALEVVCTPTAATRMSTYIVPLHEGVHLGQGRPAGTGYRALTDCESVAAAVLAGYNELEAISAELSVFCEVIEQLYEDDPAYWNDDEAEGADADLALMCNYAEGNLKNINRAIAHAEAQLAGTGVPNYPDDCSAKTIALMKAIRDHCWATYEADKARVMTWFEDFLEARGN